MNDNLKTRNYGVQEDDDESNDGCDADECSDDGTT